MIDHVGIQVSDLAASARLYDALLATVGASRQLDFSDHESGGAIGYGVDKPDFWIGAAPADQREEVHLAFVAPNRDAVRAFHRAAVEAGAEILHEPRVWPEYHDTYFGAFVRDLDGNNVEAVCHLPE